MGVDYNTIFAQFDANTYLYAISTAGNLVHLAGYYSFHESNLVLIIFC